MDQKRNRRRLIAIAV